MASILLEYTQLEKCSLLGQVTRVTRYTQDQRRHLCTGNGPGMFSSVSRLSFQQTFTTLSRTDPCTRSAVRRLRRVDSAETLKFLQQRERKLD